MVSATGEGLLQSDRVREGAKCSAGGSLGQPSNELRSARTRVQMQLSPGQQKDSKLGGGSSADGITRTVPTASPHNRLGIQNSGGFQGAEQEQAGT